MGQTKILGGNGGGKQNAVMENAMKLLGTSKNYHSQATKRLQIPHHLEIKYDPLERLYVGDLATGPPLFLQSQ
jgi:hypothetical protein